jgi:4a-hydroxytetrahydrobiopterin dehydratase
MRMKPSSVRKKISRAQARNATLLNLLGTPGLGSLLARRWFVGIGQLLLALIGFVLVTIWFVQMMLSYYGQMFSNGTAHQPPTGTNLLLGGILFALAWGWSLVTSLGLQREASKVSLESLETFAAGLIKMEPAKIILALSALPKWRRVGEIISRTFEFKDFPAAMKFVNAVAELAEQAQHHPDVDIRWNKVTLALTTHDAGGLTEKDFELARQIDREAKQQNAN